MKISPFTIDHETHIIWTIWFLCYCYYRKPPFTPRPHISIEIFGYSYLKFQFCSKLQNLQNRAIVLFTEFVSPCFYSQKCSFDAITRKRNKSINWKWVKSILAYAKSSKSLDRTLQNPWLEHPNELKYGWIQIRSSSWCPRMDPFVKSYKGKNRSSNATDYRISSTNSVLKFQVERSRISENLVLKRKGLHLKIWLDLFKIIFSAKFDQINWVVAMYMAIWDNLYHISHIIWLKWQHVQ